MIAVSSSRSAQSRKDVPTIGTSSASTEREASRYDGRLTDWERFTSLLATGGVIGTLVVLMLLFGNTTLMRKAKERSLSVFSVAPPPPDAVVPAPLPPIKVAAILVPRIPQPQPQLPTVVTPVLSAAAAPVAAPAVSPPTATTSSAAPAAPSDTAPAYVANPTCTIAAPAYPTRAKRLQQTGTVRVAITMDASGRIVAETVRKTSGYDSLDQAALATVHAGKCRASADGRPMASVLPIVFTLDR